MQQTPSPEEPPLAGAAQTSPPPPVPAAAAPSTNVEPPPSPRLPVNDTTSASPSKCMVTHNEGGGPPPSSEASSNHTPPTDPMASPTACGDNNENKSNNNVAGGGLAPVGDRSTRRPSWNPNVRKSSLGRKLEAARAIDQQVLPGAVTTTTSTCHEDDHSCVTQNSQEEEEEENDSVPRLRTTRLSRGGVYVQTCIGPIQIGIPPETIKDCLGGGMSVPRYYIVPAERFNRQLGNNMGINVAEFEFPAYYNFFFHRQSVNLIVDNQEVEDKIRIVFQETLFGPETIDPSVDYIKGYPEAGKPDLHKELQYFRRFGDTILTIDMLLSFTHFSHGVAVIEKDTPQGKVKVTITKSGNHGGEYHFSEHFEKEVHREETGEPILPGKAIVSGIVQLPDRLRQSLVSPHRPTRLFVPPMFGVTVLGSSHGFDPLGSTSGYVLWVNRRGIMIDPPPHSSSILEKNQIHPSVIDAVIVTHCHADHDAGTFQKILCEKRIVMITTPTIYESFIRKYSALSGIDPDYLRSSHKFRPVKIGESIKLRGGIFSFFYSLHSIPCVGFEVQFGSKSMVFSADHMNDPERIEKMFEEGIFSAGRRAKLLNFPWHHDAILHEAGIPPIHTPMKTLEALPDDVKSRLHIVHVAASSIPAGKNLKAAMPGVENTIVLDVDVPEFSEAISVLNLIGDIYFFSGLSLTHARGLLEIGYKKRYSAGSLIMERGAVVNDFYLLLTGLLEVTYFDEVSLTTPRSVHWAMGDWFGEEALLGRHDHGMKAEEQIKALTDVELIVFAGSELHYLFADTTISQRVQHLMQLETYRLEKLLMLNTTLCALTRAQKLHLESLSDMVQYKAQDYVWKHDDPATCCVIVHTGSLSYEIDNNDKVLMKSLIRRSASMLVAGEDINQAYCPPSFEKGAFLGSVTAVLQQHHGGGINKCHGTSLICNTDATLMVFRDDHLREFFSTHPGVLLCLLDTHFVL